VGVSSLICSDVMARGMDLPSVDLVVNYDATPFLRTYIHRIGRTARAGRAGTAISLLRGKEVRHFKEMLWKAQNATLQPFPTIAPDTLKPLVPVYTVRTQLSCPPLLPLLAAASLVPLTTGVVTSVLWWWCGAARFE
jgi:superfamily II DNA/RNA helicase